MPSNVPKFMEIPFEGDKIHTHDGTSKYNKPKRRGKSIEELQALKKKKFWVLKGGVSEDKKTST